MIEEIKELPPPTCKYSKVVKLTMYDENAGCAVHFTLYDLQDVVDVVINHEAEGGIRCAVSREYLLRALEFLRGGFVAVPDEEENTK